MTQDVIVRPWWIERTTTDMWSFGLLMSNGFVIAIQCVHDVRIGPDGSLWADVELAPHGSSFFCSNGKLWGEPVCAPTSRLKASINASHVMAVVELADT